MMKKLFVLTLLTLAVLAMNPDADPRLLRAVDIIGAVGIVAIVLMIAGTLAYVIARWQKGAR